MQPRLSESTNKVKCISVVAVACCITPSTTPITCDPMIVICSRQSDPMETFFPVSQVSPCCAPNDLSQSDSLL